MNKKRGEGIVMDREESLSKTLKAVYLQLTMRYRELHERERLRKDQFISSALAAISLEIIFMVLGRIRGIQDPTYMARKIRRCIQQGNIRELEKIEAQLFGEPIRFTDALENYIPNLGLVEIEDYIFEAIAKYFDIRR